MGTHGVRTRPVVWASPLWLQVLAADADRMYVCTYSYCTHSSLCSSCHCAALLVLRSGGDGVVVVCVRACMCAWAWAWQEWEDCGGVERAGGAIAADEGISDADCNSVETEFGCDRVIGCGDRARLVEGAEISSPTLQQAR
eukprot:GHVU01065924.1.p2 GENE.GHVU01065924.1~~GHVU01065924.1.p2  ORF type:complete len:141 (+),score=8.90 GHVU01065924.1:554-976(+)